MISAGGRIRIIVASSRSISFRMRILWRWIIPGAPISRLAVYFRHVGITHDEELSPRLRELASTRILDRARVPGVLRCASPTWCRAVDAGRAAENPAEGQSAAS